MLTLTVPVLPPPAGAAVVVVGLEGAVVAVDAIVVVVECVVVVRVVDVAVVTVACGSTPASVVVGETVSGVGAVLTATVADLVGLDVGWVRVTSGPVTFFAHSRSELWVGGAT
jgi:hypothetical protein